MAKARILEPRPPNREVLLRTEIKALEERLAALENGLTIPLALGAVSGGREGSLAGEKVLKRLYVKMDGTWRYVALT